MNPFQDLIHKLKHNGYANTPLTAVPGQLFLNILKKSGWDQAFSGKGKTHILMRLREKDRGQACGTITMFDFARALESGVRVGRSSWISQKYKANFIVNFETQGFVTLRYHK